MNFKGKLFSESTEEKPVSREEEPEQNLWITFPASSSLGVPIQEGVVKPEWGKAAISGPVESAISFLCSEAIHLHRAAALFLEL